MCRVYCYMYIKQTYNHTLQCTCITFDYNNEYDVFFSYKTLYLHQVSIGNTYIYKKGFNRFFLIFGETEHLYAYPSEDNVHVYSIVNPVRFI